MFGQAAPKQELICADPHFCEPAFWEAEQQYGCIEISFDPVTGQRKRIFLNTRFANIYGFHREELVARFANHDAGLQRTDIDSLLVLLDGLQHALDDSKAAPVERYFRMYSGPARTPLLVWTLWGKSLDQSGQFFKVIFKEAREAGRSMSAPASG